LEELPVLLQLVRATAKKRPRPGETGTHATPGEQDANKE
jgi:hypothetical protein